MFQQPSRGWAWRAFNTPVSLPKAKGDSYSLLLEEILGSALPPQPALCLEVSTEAKFVIIIRYLSKIIRDLVSGDSKAQTWVSGFSRQTQRYLLAPQRETHIAASLRWCWQTDRETLGIAFKCFFTEGMDHPMLQCCKRASQHEGLPCSYLNVLLADHFAIADRLRAGRQSDGAESSAHIKNKHSSYDLQSSMMPKIQIHHILPWFLLSALHVFSWKGFISCPKVSTVKRGHTL